MYVDTNKFKKYAETMNQVPNLCLVVGSPVTSVFVYQGFRTVCT